MFVVISTVSLLVPSNGFSIPHIGQRSLLNLSILVLQFLHVGIYLPEIIIARLSYSIKEYNAYFDFFVSLQLISQICRLFFREKIAMAKLSIEKKNKLIYSGELIVISVVFLVIGILELLSVIKLSERFQLIFKIVTLVGASWIVIDFAWVMLSKKRRARNSLLDKVMLLPLAAYLFGFDIAGFVYPRNYSYYQIGVPLAFFYFACAYLFQGVYHYYVPIPLIKEAIEEEEKEAAQKALEEANKENEEPQKEEENIKGDEKGE